MAIYEINCDCTPHYIQLSRSTAAKLEKLISKAKIGGWVTLVELSPMRVGQEQLLRVVANAIARDGALVKGRITCESRTWVEQFGNHWYAENANLRPLTAREKGNR